MRGIRSATHVSVVLPVPPTLQVALPHPLLAAHVQRYLEVRFETPEGQPLLHRLSALASPVFVLTLSGEVFFGSDEHSLAPVPLVSLTGPLAEAALNRYRGTMHGFMVRFTPWGARALLGVWGSGLPGEMVFPAEAVPAPLRAPLRAWTDRLAEAPDFSTRAALTDTFLLQRLRSQQALNTSVRPALEVIAQTSGALSITAIARQLGTPESTLRRHLVETTGLSPKRHAQITRFRHAWRFLQATPRATWADVVNRFGYTDQSHFIHEHRRFTGEPPGALDADARFMDRTMGLGDDRARP